MKPRLAIPALATLLVSCGALPRPEGWPAIWPGWEEEPTVKSADASDGLTDEAGQGSDAGRVVDAPDAPAVDPTLAVVVPMEPGAALSGAGAPPPEDADTGAPESGTAIARSDDSEAGNQSDPGPRTAAPEPVEASAPIGPTPPTPPPLTSGLLAGLTLHDEAGDVVGGIRDLFVDDEGAVCAVLLDRAGHELTVLPRRAIEWSSVPPKLLAALPRVDARALFAAVDLVDLDGTVSAMDESGAGCALIVRDEGNLLHRVLLPDKEILLRAAPGLEVGVGVRLRAAPSRDSAGKVWIPAAIQVGPIALSVRTEDGAPVLGELLAPATSLADLLGASVTFRDAPWVAVNWSLDRVEVRVTDVEIERDGDRILLPWTEVVLR